MINKILLYFYNLYFKLFKIDENQSLIYQIMIILMHIHKMKRFGIFEEVEYLGTDYLVITEDEFEIVGNKIKKFLTYNNRDLVDKSNSNPLLLIAFNSSLNNSKYYEIKKIKTNDKKMIVFSITNEGYSYQYNGYKRNEVRLQDKANFFAMIAIFGASFSWLVDKEFIDYKSYLSLGKSFLIYLELSMFYFFRKKNLKRLFLMFIIFIIIDFIIYYFITRSANEVYYYKIYYRLY